MLTIPESNVALTDEQTASVEAAKTILLNLETETTRASRALNVLKNDIVKASEEKEYISEQISSLNTSLREKQTALDGLNDAIVKTKSDHESVIEQHASISLKIDSAIDSLNEREKKITELESSLSQEKANLAKEQNILIQERADVDTAREAFLIAVKTVSWK